MQILITSTDETKFQDPQPANTSSKNRKKNEVFQ